MPNRDVCTINKDDFSRFWQNKPKDYLYFAAHSHHPWPNCSYDAHVKYWQDSADMLGDKWGYVMGQLIPALQQQISKIIQLSHQGKSICFAPNTHEFVTRLLSNLPTEHIPHILTTDSEFYSFDRQINRLSETNQLKVTKISLSPTDTFETRFSDAAAQHKYDMVFFSHVFFNAGYQMQGIDSLIPKLRQSLGKEPPIIIDGYHAFMACPVDLSNVQRDVFYIAGGYKYAMSGEGCCFMHCPDHYIPKPINTGWFAAMDHLSDMHDVPYHDDTNGMRFMGATFDPSGLYRMHAVFNWLERTNITVADTDHHINQLMRYFTEQALTKITWLTVDMLVVNPVNNHAHGHFIALNIDSAGAICQHLARQNVICDHRGDILRFGFGIYHDIADVDLLITHLQQYQG